VDSASSRAAPSSWRGGAGAQEAAAGAMRSRRVELDWRDGKIEKVTEATQRSLAWASTSMAAMAR
jgi:hypothetical protein